MSRKPKRNTVGRPHFKDRSGHVSVNIADHDGIIIFGDGPFEFETKLQYLSADSVRAYNDGRNIVGVAVDSHTRPLDPNAISVPDLQALNFTSRTREASSGRSIVFENQDGHYLLLALQVARQDDEQIQMIELDYRVIENDEDDRVYSLEDPLPDFYGNFEENEDETYLVTEDGRNLTDNAGNRLVTNRPVSDDLGQLEAAIFSPFDVGLIREAAAAARDRAIAIFDSGISLSATGGIGHNDPPPEFITLSPNRQDLLDSLDTLVELHEGDRVSVERAAHIENVLFLAAGQIGRWASGKLDVMAESFAKEIGRATAYSAVIVGLCLLCGQLSQLGLLVKAALLHFSGAG